MMSKSFSGEEIVLNSSDDDFELVPTHPESMDKLKAEESDVQSIYQSAEDLTDSLSELDLDADEEPLPEESGPSELEVSLNTMTSTQESLTQTQDMEVIKEDESGEDDMAGAASQEDLLSRMQSKRLDEQRCDPIILSDVTNRKPLQTDQLMLSPSELEASLITMTSTLDSMTQDMDVIKKGIWGGETPKKLMDSLESVSMDMPRLRGELRQSQKKEAELTEELEQSRGEVQVLTRTVHELRLRGDFKEKTASSIIKGLNEKVAELDEALRKKEELLVTRQEEKQAKKIMVRLMFNKGIVSIELDTKDCPEVCKFFTDVLMRSHCGSEEGLRYAGRRLCGKHVLTMHHDYFNFDKCADAKKPRDSDCRWGLMFGYQSNWGKTRTAFFLANRKSKNEEKERYFGKVIRGSKVLTQHELKLEQYYIIEL